MKPGIYTDLSYDEYDAIDAVRSTDLKHFEKSAAHAYYERTNQRDSDAMRVGRAVHVRLLEPDVWASDYTVAPKVDRRTKAGKQAWAEYCEGAQGKIVLSAQDAEKVEGMARACAESPDAQSVLLGKGANEVTVVWQMKPEKGLPRLCKARIDRLTYIEGKPTVVDIKTTRNAEVHAFARSVIDYGYDVSAAWYLMGLRAIDPKPFNFAFLAIENDGAHVPALRDLDPEFILIGEKRAKQMFERLAQAEAADHWGGYPRASVFPPEWYVRQHLEEVNLD